ncbi:MAG: cellulose 1,4-beta-cellobiosidase [Oscillospiraceae bacterium]|jgi:hypothetical protein|nr:cellulose 1,4-beta-cellobiosidase [Oscillospiraceae bacterium]
MIFKKQKAVIAAMLSAAMAVSAFTSVASAAGTRTKAEAYGDATYAQRSLSLYDDVVTNGVANGYLSKNAAKGNSDLGIGGTGFGIPYHSVETMIIEAPDYGHETTSEAMSYITWMAAMHDILAEKEGISTTTDFVKAWSTMEQMIPKSAQQLNFFENVKAPNTPGVVEATYADEYQDPAKYPGNNSGGKVGNPLYATFKTAYGTSKDGYYLMHWLADVDDWYGYGAEAGDGAGKFTYINSFQRGEQESCWETVPHPAIETYTYGMKGAGIIAVFNGETSHTVGDYDDGQWRYTNAPDAEDRTIQAAYFANLYGVGDSDVSEAAGKMGDQMRNNMFDKYYQKIGINVDGGVGSSKGGNVANPTAGSYDSCHYLMAWYTSWGGAWEAAVTGYGGWKWQIGASHMHEFYQNPLAAYAKLYDPEINAGMIAQNATRDWETSLERQIEFYEWLQSSTGPFAGGATNSFNGRYEGWDQSAASLEGVNEKTTFYDMFYLPHPVYMDPGSNHWIGNQTWAVQRLAELYYYVVTNGDQSELNLESRLNSMLDKYVKWCVDGNTIQITDDEYGYAMAENLDWFGQPDTFVKGQVSENADLTAEITGWASGDIGVVASMANTLIYYAKAEGVDGSRAHDATVLDNGSDAEKALYYATYLLDRMWAVLRDDIGIKAPGSYDANFIHRFFTQKVYVPNGYSGTLPTGGKLTGATTNGSLDGCPTFYDIRPQYEDEPAFALIKAAYDANPSLATETFDADTINENIGDSTAVDYHRFWHEGDQIMALGAMALLYPEVEPTDGSGDPPITGSKIGDVTLDDAVGKMDDIVLLGKYLKGSIQLSSEALLNSDCDASTSSKGKIETADLSALIAYLLGTNTSLPVS